MKENDVLSQFLSDTYALYCVFSFFFALSDDLFSFYCYKVNIVFDVFDHITFCEPICLFRRICTNHFKYKYILLVINTKKCFFFVSERVEYGIGSLSKLADILDELSIKKPFLLTGTSLATKTDVIERVKDASGCKVITIFSGIQQHAPIQTIKMAVVELSNADSDGIIAVGGGSPIDAAKLMIYLYHEETGRLLKLVSIPTTLSAAEYTVIAGYTGKESLYKKILISSFMRNGHIKLISFFVFI